VIPPAGPVQTPVQVGAFPPPAGRWPANRDALGTYPINRLYPTVQGEGGQTGTPMTIVRLQGCPVGCVWCDTPESWAVPAGAQWWAAEVIAAQVELPWALVTGGEPTWYDLTALTMALAQRRIRRALETSGTFPVTGVWDWITVSPKPQGRVALEPTALGRATELKWIVGRERDVAALEAFLYTWETALFRLPGERALRISVQPLSITRTATACCLAAVVAHPTWRLSLQTHKLLGIA
jgi:7-carboxy-7-deazaguanine synthase